MSEPMKFSNGLSQAENDRIDDLIIDLTRIAMEIEGLPRHQSYSLAITKIDEARLWLRDRKSRAAS